MNTTPIFDALRRDRQFMCQACKDNGWPYALFLCDGDGLCD